MKFTSPLGGMYYSKLVRQK